MRRESDAELDRFFALQLFTSVDGRVGPKPTGSSPNVEFPQHPAAPLDTDPPWWLNNAVLFDRSGPFGHRGSSDGIEPSSLSDHRKSRSSKRPIASTVQTRRTMRFSCRFHAHRPDKKEDEIFLLFSRAPPESPRTMRTEKKTTNHICFVPVYCRFLPRHSRHATSALRQVIVYVWATAWLPYRAYFENRNNFSTQNKINVTIFIICILFQCRV